MINIQPIEKRIVSDGKTLKIHSIFQTIQGEGPFTGHPATFIRLAGCNIQCPQCDTVYTGDAVTEQAIKEITTKVHPNRLVVITGGEPFRQNITPLCDELLWMGCKVQIETNGTLPPPPGFPKDVVVVCSPKTSKVHPDTAWRADCYKYVMSHDSVSESGLPKTVLGNVSDVYKQHGDKQIYLQPVDSYNEEGNAKNLKACVDSCTKFGHILQLQIHKIIGVE